MRNQKRDLYWAVKLDDGTVFTGVKCDAICTTRAYIGVLKRKYRNWKHISVGIGKSAQVI